MTRERVFVAGHRGLVGSAIVRALAEAGAPDPLTRTSQELDLRDQQATDAFFAAERPEAVYLAAARVGGIHANHAFPAEFVADNLQIQTNVIAAAHAHGVKKLLFLGSSCIYPRMCPQPMREDHLLTGPLEPTNEPYAIAKISGIIMCESFNRQYGTNYIAAMPTNLYGPNDNFDLETSHVLPAMIRKFHDAKVAGRQEVELWGTGSPRREFLHVDDLADALLFMMANYEPDPLRPYLNVGTGSDVSIKELAQTIAGVVGYDGQLRWNTDMPDGTPRKLLDVSRLTDAGWRASISLVEGIKSTYDWYLENRS